MFKTIKLDIPLQNVANVICNDVIPRMLMHGSLNPEKLTHKSLVCRCLTSIRVYDTLIAIHFPE